MINQQFIGKHNILFLGEINADVICRWRLAMKLIWQIRETRLLIVAYSMKKQRTKIRTDLK